MELEFLGTGTSQGVPVITCNCEVCTSDDPRDNRLRTSALIRVDGKNIVIDAGPDFRQQMLRAKVPSVDAILITHEHKDHVAGLDDIRPYNFSQNQAMNIYIEERGEESLKREFAYVFAKKKYPGVPMMNLNRVTNHAFLIGQIKIEPIRVMHMKLPIFGYRIGKLAYITDASYIAPEELEKLKGVEVLVINALRKEKHYSHFSLGDALEVINIISPQRAYLTHVSHAMGCHAEVQDTLPANIYLAYDNLRVTI